MNETQVNRLKAVRTYIQSNFNELIEAQDIARIAYYSYRNINRIFNAVYGESIGAYIKRVRLEALAKAVIYTDQTITEIAYDAGYSDLQAFNKAFKALYGCSPLQFRKEEDMKKRMWMAFNEPKLEASMKTIEHRIETVPDLSVLYLTYHGKYEAISEIQDTWRGLLEYADRKQLIDERTLFLGEVLDDESVTPDYKCRYNCSITLARDSDFIPTGFFNIKTIPAQKYAVFTHRGSYESMNDTYEIIYGHWVLANSFELVNRPILEFYLNSPSEVEPKDLLSEIYIPIE